MFGRFREKARVAIVSEDMINTMVKKKNIIT